MARIKKTVTKPKATRARKASEHTGSPQQATSQAPQPSSTREQLSSIIKSARDLMRKDAGLNGDLDRLPQLSWVLFLKCYDDLEKAHENNAILSGQKYRSVIPKPFRWRDWASDPDHGQTGPELIDFVNNQLLPKLRELSGNDQKVVIAALFRETYNRMLSGYLLRDLVNKIDGVHFLSRDEIFTLSHLYESMLKEMRDAAGDSGEFYTPRPVVKFMVGRVAPNLQKRESVLDPAGGTCGFLVEAYDFMKAQRHSSADEDRLQNETLHGVEKKPMPYLLGTMNMILHGIESPNIQRTNALDKPLKEIGDADRFDVIVTNPPFGGEEEAGIQLNFPEATRTSETALLFMQFIMRSLKPQGRCAMVVPNGTLFGDGVAAKVKEKLLTEFNLHTIVRLPNGVFAPYTGIPTNLLFFDRTGPTHEIWYYDQPMPEGRKNYSKTKPMQNEDWAECVAWWDNRVENDRAWKVSASDVLKYDDQHNIVSVNLDIKNPTAQDDFVHLPPEQLAADILKKEQRIAEIMAEIQSTLRA